MPTEIRNISLRRRLIKIHSTRRLQGSYKYLRQEIARFASVSPDAISISQDLNRYMMLNAMRMRDIKVSVEKAGTSVKLDLSPELKPKKAVVDAATQKSSNQAKDAKKPVEQKQEERSQGKGGKGTKEGSTAQSKPQAEKADPESKNQQNGKNKGK